MHSDPPGLRIGGKPGLPPVLLQTVESQRSVFLRDKTKMADTSRGFCDQTVTKGCCMVCVAKFKLTALTFELSGGDCIDTDEKVM